MRRNRMGLWTIVLTIAMAVANQATAAVAVAEKSAENKEAPLVQMAILLDHSGSMRGLINQARAHLWKIVNEFATVRRDGMEPRLEVAVYKYGNGKPELLVGLTDDLDKVSEMLFAISISGGKENCGQVIDAATRELKWTKNDKDLKCIFIAGNEPFTQGPVDYKQACKDAIAKGITVSTIHCGARQTGINGMWEDGALLADGTYIDINQNRQEVAVNAPQDKKITELNKKLNTTYIAFGTDKQREAVAKNQAEQDSNAKKLSISSFAGRALSKSNAQYVCRWDLVDACRLGEVKLAEIKKEQLPKELQKLSQEELKAYVDKKAAERKKIQDDIKKLSAERNKYVVAERARLAKEKGEKAGNRLDEAIVKSVREQAKRKQFTVGTPAAPSN